MLSKFKLKYSHLIITTFVALNVIFLALIAANPFNLGASAKLHAAPVCNFNNTSYFATVAVIVKTTSPSVTLPNSLNLSTKTGVCSNGWDNGIPYNSGYNQSNQDPFLQSTSFDQGHYIYANDIVSYYDTHHSAPSTFQIFPAMSASPSAGTATTFTCAAGQDNSGCAALGGNIKRTVQSSSQVTIEYYQVIDCAFSPVNYSLTGLPQGWTVSGASNTVNVVNSPAVPTYTITISPPKPTINVSLSCKGVSWNTTNVNGTVSGDIVLDSNGKEVVSIPTDNHTSGTYSSFVSSLENNNVNYIAKMSATGNGQTASAESNVFDFYNCVQHIPAPTLSVSLSCSGVNWKVGNFESGYSLKGTVENSSNNSVVAQIPTQTSATGTYNGFVSNLEQSNQNYKADMILNYSGKTLEAESNSFNFYNCINHVPGPVLFVTLNCNGVTWNVQNFQSGYSLSGNIDNTSGSSVAQIPTESSATGTYNGFVSSLEQNNQNYYANMTLNYSGKTLSEKSDTFNFYDNCLPTPTLQVTLNCNGVGWQVGSFQSGDSVSGNIDNTSGSSVAQIPTESSATGTYNGFVSSLEQNNQNYYANLVLNYDNGKSLSVKSSQFNFYNCVSHTPAPVLSSVTMSCVENSSNLNIAWTYDSTTTNSSDMFYGTINDTTTNQNGVATFEVPVSNGTYTWNGANTTDSYTVTGYIMGSNGKSSSITSSSESVNNCITPQTPVMSSISLACENNTTNNLSVTWQAQNVTNSDTFNGVITDVTTGAQVSTIPATPANLGEYIWQGANGTDSYTVTGWIENSNGQKFNVTTSAQVSSNCIPQKPVTPVVQQPLPQTSGSAPIGIFVIAGIVILSLGVSMLAF